VTDQDDSAHEDSGESDPAASDSEDSGSTESEDSDDDGDNGDNGDNDDSSEDDSEDSDCSCAYIALLDGKAPSKIITAKINNMIDFSTLNSVVKNLLIYIYI
jgi:hypothetical protein